MDGSLFMQPHNVFFSIVISHILIVLERIYCIFLVKIKEFNTFSSKCSYILIKYDFIPRVYDLVVKT